MRKWRFFVNGNFLDIHPRRFIRNETLAKSGFQTQISLRNVDLLDSREMFCSTRILSSFIEVLPPGSADALRCSVSKQSAASKRICALQSTSASRHIAEPRIADNQAVAVASLPKLTLHGLRRCFATLSEWDETPNGVATQTQGHAPYGVREQSNLGQLLDLLRLWHMKVVAS